MKHRYQKSLIFLMICSFAYITLMWHMKSKSIKVMYIKIPHPSPQRHVNTEGCVIPYFDPFDKSIMNYYVKPRRMNCSARTPLTYQDGLTLTLDNRSISYCTSQNIIRSKSQDNKYSFSSVTNFTSSFKVSSEFIRVRCFNKSGSHVYSNLHAFTPRNKTRTRDLSKLLEKHKQKNKPVEVLNVLMIGIDSLSRLNHIRLMPKTRHYLVHNMSAVDFQGYTKVADNTYVNMTPLLTGNFVKDENKKQGIKNPRGPFDKYNLIWKNFSSNGYTTLTAEDNPYLGTFNFQKYGFSKPPSHHYLRPFSLAFINERGVHWTKKRFCAWNRTESEVVLDYTYDFVKTYRDVPNFTWCFLTRMTHDNNKDAAFVDHDYFRFLTKIHKEGLLNNTILFFFSDHGVRFGHILWKTIGQKETRMPIMNIVFPPWFREKYPEIYRNVLSNANKLTSPFDIYETLNDILYFTGKSRKSVNTDKAGISLFDSIPGSRTCDDASILPHWCVCEFKPIKLNDKLSNDSMRFLVEHINLKISNYSMCSKRDLKSVRYVKGFSYSGSSNATTTIIRSFFTLTPDNATFEATVQFKSKQTGFRLFSAINRVNKYGTTADCLKIAKLKKFCYCIMNSTESLLKTSFSPHTTRFKPLHSTPRVHINVTSKPVLSKPRHYRTTSKPHHATPKFNINAISKPVERSSRRPHTTSKSRHFTSPHRPLKKS